jgi:hypothetical protein
MTKDEITTILVLELQRGLNEITADLALLRSFLVTNLGSEQWVTLSEKLRAEERRKLTMLERLANGELPDDETAWDKIRKS